MTLKRTAYFAGGCFWCVEHDLKKLPGVINAVSGYAGDVKGKKPSYYDHEGFREAVKIEYDTTKISFRKLCQFFVDHIDPTDAGGQFYDRGLAYQTAIFYETEKEQEIAKDVIQELEESKLYEQPISVKVLSKPTFYEAEEYHQNYSEKNPTQYKRYREGSGREDFINQVCQLRLNKKVNWKEKED